MSLAPRLPLRQFAGLDLDRVGEPKTGGWEVVEQSGMLENADLRVTARIGGKLVGVSRAVTDYSYCVYLSDLAVDEAYQKQGIGRELIRLTQSRLGSKAKIILLAAPKAEAYYPRIGFDAHRSAWLLSATKKLP